MWRLFQPDLSMKKKNTPEKKPVRDFLPEAPYVTDPWAIHEYRRVTTALGNKANELDMSLLIEYAQTFADTVNLRTQVEEEGVKLIGAKGGEYINPTVGLLSSRLQHLAQLRRDLYFTPRSRIERVNKTKSKAGDILAALDDHDDEAQD